MAKRQLGWVCLLLILATRHAGVAAAETCSVGADSQCTTQSPDSPEDPQPESSPSPQNTSQEGSPGAENPAAPQTIDSLEERMLAMVNAERANAGLPALNLQPWARTVAREHSGNMAAAHSIWHNDNYFAQGRKAMAANFLGENVVMADSLEKAQKALMDSPPHRQNILAQRFSHLGVGIVRGGDGLIYATQGFARIPPLPAQSIPHSKGEPESALVTSIAPTAGSAGITVIARIEAPTAIDSTVNETESADAPAMVLSAFTRERSVWLGGLALGLLITTKILLRLVRASRRTAFDLEARVKALFTALGEAR